MKTKVLKLKARIYIYLFILIQICQQGEIDQMAKKITMF